MEIIKKKILYTGGNYNVKVLLNNTPIDLGFFDAFIQDVEISTTTTTTSTTTTSTSTTSTSTTSTSTTSTTTQFPYSGDLEFVNITPTNFTSVPRNTTFSFSVTVKTTNYYPIPYKLYLDGFDDIKLGLDGLLPSTFSQDQYPDTFTNTVAKDVPFHLGTILDGETDVFEGTVKNDVDSPAGTWGLFVRLFIDKANNGIYTEAANIVSWDITQ